MRFVGEAPQSTSVQLWCILRLPSHCPLRARAGRGELLGAAPRICGASHVNPTSAAAEGPHGAPAQSSHQTELR